MNIKTELNNSNNIFVSNIKKIYSEQEQNDKNKNFINDQGGITVGDHQKTFYYYYDNNQYYFTVKNAKFSIDFDGFITWYYGQWMDGFFRNGLWIDGIWHNGTFCRGNWIDGIWENGNWYKGEIQGSPSAINP